MFYGAVMSQQNKNWGRYASIVFQFFPPRPDEYIERVPRTRAGIIAYCKRIEKTAPANLPLRHGKPAFPKWSERYSRARIIARRMLDLHEQYGGARRYYRDIYHTKGLSGLLNEAVRDDSLPGIGRLTARNSLRDVFGVDLVKADVVLQRIFRNFGWIKRGQTDPEVFQAICQSIGIHRAAVVDHVFWVFGNSNGKKEWGIGAQMCGGEIREQSIRLRKIARIVSVKDIDWFGRDDLVYVLSIS